MFDILFTCGGLVGYALLACSLLAVAMTLFSAAKLIPQHQAGKKIQQAFLHTSSHCSPDDISQIAQQEHALARVLRAGIQQDITMNEGQRHTHTFDAAQREVDQLEQGLSTLATIAHITPLLGLLGTVLGLIDAFQQHGPTKHRL